MAKSVLVLVSFALACVHASVYSPYTSPNTLPDRQTIVHLFEWKWTDIAVECETFLSKYGFGAVQISPPNEHLLQTQANNNMPWWIRYQPVSYKLDKSRSGTEAEFIDMVNRCNNVGVRIIVDGVINHMNILNQKYPGQLGTWSSAGSNFDASHGIETFPAVPYSETDFHDYACDDIIHPDDYNNNAQRVRTCRLNNLLDLDHSKDYVRQKISDYLNHVIDLGVAGIRIDAAKHMFVPDIQAIIGMLKNVNTTIYGEGKRPYIVQEVISNPGEAIKCEEYINTGRVTNFDYGVDIAAAVHRSKDFQYFYNFGPAWSYLPDDVSMVFIDNHDNQRTDPRVLTYQRDGYQYLQGVAYMLAWTYGYPRVMSSYAFPADYPDQGPPNSGSPDWITNSPTFRDDGTCAPESGWICEHRMLPVRNMVKFRSVVVGTAPANIITEANRIAFRRGNKGFFAMNNADATWQRNMYTGLPQGTYCDVITGEYDEKTNRCTGQQITVDSNGNADVFTYQRNMAAFHIEQRIPDTPIPTPTPLPSTFQRTVIMVHKQTDLGQSLFIRGGLDETTHNCNGDTSAATSNCAVPIVAKTNVSMEDFRSYFNWAQEDEYLDWFGNEPNQGTYDGIMANGTPIVWTTNKPGAFGYHPLNTYGDDYWLADLLMDCSRTDNNWFVLKSFLKPSLISGAGTWENDISQDAQCQGGAAGPTPSNIGKNHAGLCGAINVYDFGTNGCEIKQF